MDLKTLQSLFKVHKELLLFGRYINGDDIIPLLKKHSSSCKIEVVGKSVLGEPIHLITLGSGKKRFLCGLKCTEMKAPLRRRFSICATF